MSNVLNQEEIDAILSYINDQNDDPKFVKLDDVFTKIRNKRVAKFFNHSDPLREYMPYVIVSQNPSISVEFNKIVNKILVLESEIIKQIFKLRKKSKYNDDKDYEKDVKKLKSKITEYKKLFNKYSSLNDLKNDLLNNQRQR